MEHIIIIILLIALGVVLWSRWHGMLYISMNEQGIMVFLTTWLLFLMHKFHLAKL